MRDIQASMTILKRNQWDLHTVLLFLFPCFCWQIISVSEHLSLLFHGPSSCCMTGKLLQDFFLFLWLLIWVTGVWLSSFVFWMLLSISLTTSCSLLFLRPHESTDVTLCHCVNTNREFTSSAWFSSFMDDGALNLWMSCPQRIRSDHFPSSDLIPFSRIPSASNVQKCFPPDAAIGVGIPQLPQQMTVDCTCSSALNPSFVEFLQVTFGSMAVVQFSLF